MVQQARPVGCIARGSLFPCSLSLCAPCYCGVRATVYVGGLIFLSYMYVIVYGSVFIGFFGIKWENMNTYKILAGIIAALGLVWYVLRVMPHALSLHLTCTCCATIVAGVSSAQYCTGARAHAYVPEAWVCAAATSDQVSRRLRAPKPSRQG